MEDIEALFTRPHSRGGWYDTLNPDEKKWVDDVVAASVDKGRRPSTGMFCQVFEKRFSRSVSPGTARKALRLLTGLE